MYLADGSETRAPARLAVLGFGVAAMGAETLTLSWLTHRSCQGSISFDIY
jgi:hypothetical protein